MDMITCDETCLRFGKVSRFQLATRVMYVINDFALCKELFNRDACSARDDKWWMRNVRGANGTVFGILNTRQD
jgi:hypothetical protein